MGNTCQIVDTISGSPTVLLDLNNDNPNSVAKFDAPPPQLVRSIVQSQLQDGALEASTVYGDRILELDLDLFAATQDSSATTWQILARLLADPRGQWLKYQPSGATAPVFFRTRRADITAIVDIPATAALRKIHLSIPAKPFAYGLLESASMVIANDPTTGTNKMTYLMPSAKGDVPAPLWMKLQQSGNAWDALISMSCLPVGAAGGVPIWSGAIDVSSAAANFAWSSTADATAISGTRKRATKSAGGNSTQTTKLTAALANVLRGDYRLLARVEASAADTTVGANVYDHDAPGSLDTPTQRDIDVTTWGWVDCGIVRVPRRAPLTTLLLDQGHTTSTNINIVFNVPTASTVDIDGILLIPAGLDTAIETRSALVSGGTLASSDLYVDGESEQVYAKATASTAVTIGTFAGGGFPRVVPNADNHLNLVRARKGTDTKTWNITVDWSYYPRYLSIRPATT